MIRCMSGRHVWSQRIVWLAGLLVLACAPGATRLRAQTAPELQSGAPERRPGETDDQKAVRLLDEMVKALGGDAWLNKQTETIEGQSARFFRGQPTGIVTRYVEYLRLPNATTPAGERIDFVSPRSQLLAEGYHTDVVHLWTATQGFEYTYKGRSDLPEDQVAEYLRRRKHTLEEVMRTWVKQPGVMIIYEGLGQQDRHEVEKVSVLAANNDAVEIEIDRNSHLPLERSFEWRNQQFQDHDVDEEVYGDWRMVDGIMTPLNVTRYKNGDIADQSFYKKVDFNKPLPPNTFDEEHISLKKK